MKKIPTLFKRDFTKHGHPIKDKYNDGVEWALNGEGVATRKYDGMCCMVLNGKLYKRYELKPGRIAPVEYEEVDRDEATSKSFGWIPVSDGPEDKYFREAWENLHDNLKNIPGTCELVGPKVQGNPEKYDCHQLIRHNDAQILFPPITFDGLREWLSTKDIEGIVWHHTDGRMAKIKKRDFGLRR